MKRQLIKFGNRLVSLPGVRGLFFSWTRNRIPIFLLHRAANLEYSIHGYDIDALMAFVDTLQEKGIKVVSLEEIIRLSETGSAPSLPMVSFTADDGYDDQATILGRAFAERGLPLTIFLITDFLDGESWPWDAKIAQAFAESKLTTVTTEIGRLNLEFDLSSAEKKLFARREFQLICKRLIQPGFKNAIESLCENLEVDLPALPPPQYRSMSWDQARELEQQGVTFAPHTCSHRVLSRLTEKDVTRELADSWQRVSLELENALKVVAWPIGGADDFGERELQIAKSLGYRGAVAAQNKYSVIRAEKDPFNLDRFGFGADEGSETPWQIVTGVRRAISSLGKSERHDRRSTDPSTLGGIPATATLRARRRTRLGSIMSMCAAKVGWHRRPSPKSLRDIRRVIFVCQGNICRSPYAAALASEFGIPAISCGIRANNIAGADEVAARIAFGRRVNLANHQSTHIDNLDVGPQDLLLGMEPRHLTVLESMASQTGAHASLLGLWGSPVRPWIEDPYGLAPAAFENAFKQIERSVMGMLPDLPHLGRNI